MKTNLQLSYSSMNEVLTCQTKYAHRKVWGTVADTEDDTKSLQIGKTFHKVLERSFHRAFHEEHLKEALEEYFPNKDYDQDDVELLRKMGAKYVQLHLLSGLEVVKVEFELLNSKYRGFIDAIMVDDAGGWWIGDLKTAARYDHSLLPRLPKDLQLNLYSVFAHEMQERIPELEGKQFRGCRYRVTTKTKVPQAYDIVIPVSVMSPSTAYIAFEGAYEVALGVHNGVVPTRNYKACYDFHRPCQYFSQCHGAKFNDPAGVIVLTADILQETNCL